MITLYYSVKSGLKVGESSKEGTTTFSNYQTVSGIKIPYTISQSMQGMDMEFKVKSFEINKATDADFK